jgi:hypothetical protein
LIVEVLRYRTARFNAQLADLAEGVATADEKIASVFDWYDRWVCSPEFHGCLFAYALAEFGDAAHPGFQAVAMHKGGLRQRLLEIHEAEMPVDRAESAASALFMLLEGVTFSRRWGRAMLPCATSVPPQRASLPCLAKGNDCDRDRPSPLCRIPPRDLERLFALGRRTVVDDDGHEPFDGRGRCFLCLCLSASLPAA